MTPALRRAQARVDAALANMEFVREKEQARLERKAALNALKEEKKQKLKENLDYQRKKAQSLLISISFSSGRYVSMEMIDDFLSWKKTAQGENAYVKAKNYLETHPITIHFPVLVKAMNGSLIELEYSPQKDLQQLTEQLTTLEPELYPRHATQVIRIEETKEPVQEGELFGCLVLNRSHVTLMREPGAHVQVGIEPHVESWREEMRSIYTFTVHPQGFHSQKIWNRNTRAYVDSLPSRPMVIHFTYWPRVSLSPEWNQVENEKQFSIGFNSNRNTLLSILDGEFTNSIYESNNGFRLTDESKAEIRSIFQARRRY